MVAEPSQENVDNAKQRSFVAAWRRCHMQINGHR